MQTYFHYCSVHIVLVGDKHLREIILQVGFLEYFRLKEGQSGIIPASAGTTLVFNRCYGQFYERCKVRLVELSRVCGRGVVRCCVSGDSVTYSTCVNINERQGEQERKNQSFHILRFK